MNECQKWSMRLAPTSHFSGMPLKNYFQINTDELKNPNWWKADQLAINKHDQGVELGST